MMSVCHLKVLWSCCFVLLNFLGRSEQGVCDRPKRVYNLTADVIIGGLIPVHAGSPLRLNKPGIIWAEAMMFAIDEINKNQQLLPKTTLGFDIRDSCNQVDLALSAALDFVLSADLHFASPPYDEDELLNNDTKCDCSGNTTSFPPVLAVVGGASSRISTSVSPLFSTYDIPQISYSSTSPSLSDKTRYRSFFRTIPSDVHQAKAIADILVYYQWTYVSVVVSDDEYGRNGLTALRARLKEVGICVAVEAVFATSSTENMQRDSRNIIRQLQERKQSTVVVLWCERPKAIDFLREAETKLFNVTWIGTESWGDNSDVKKEISFDLIGGMLGVLPFLGRHQEFEDHLRRLTPWSVATDRNPWLAEYWNESEFRNCTADLDACADLPSAARLPLNKYANVMDAVYAIAHALHNLTDSDARPFTMDARTSGRLMSNVQHVNFKPRSARGNFTFTRTHDPEYGSYLIKNLQRHREVTRFETVAEWDGERTADQRLQFNRSQAMQWNNGGARSLPLSHCSQVCGRGFYVVFTSEECCWNCVKCPDGFFKDRVNNTGCERCPASHVSNENRTTCVELEEDFLAWNSAMAIVVVVFCFFGLVLVGFTLAVFRKYSDTAVVKASNRELSAIHLVCHGLIFLLSLLYIGRPSDTICLLRAYFFSTLFTVVTSIVFLKTDRIVRIFNSKSRLSKRSHLLSNRIQFVFTFVLACVPVAGTTAWVVLSPLTVTAERSTSGDESHVVFCGGSAGNLHVIQLSYILLLALLCTYEAYSARRLPESFNEAKFICFAMFGFVLLWLGYIPGFMGAAGSTKQLITCLFTLLTNLTVVSIIYGPKLNLILFRPRENSHGAFRTATLNSCIQEVSRLSPMPTPNMRRGSPAAFFEVHGGKPRSGTQLTDDSMGSRELVITPRTGSNFMALDNPLTVPSPQPARSFNDNPPTTAGGGDSTIVPGQPLRELTDSDNPPKFTEASLT